eukprot:symbB.v1.2.022920.t1/scaffold2055.1/size90941/6
MQETGQADSSASLEEMQQQVASDVCQLDENGNPKAGCNEDADLPWTGAEELLVKSTVKGPTNEKSKESSKEETNEKIEESMKESLEIEVNAKPYGSVGVIVAVLLSLSLAATLVWTIFRHQPTADRVRVKFSTSIRSRAAICRANLLDARRQWACGPSPRWHG